MTRSSYQGESAPRNDRRRYDRVKVLWDAAIEDSLGIACDCMLLELSANGARVRMAVPYEDSTPIKLRSTHFGSLQGRVVWHKDRVLGLQFQSPPADVLAELRRPLPDLAAA